jgi:transposase
MGSDQSTKFIGLDVHKNTISLAIAKSGADEEVRFYGTIRNTPEAIDKVDLICQS